jgi:putative aldouronate transport system substrate-binding protein
MKRRILVLLLVVCLLSTTFVACSQSDKVTDTSKPKETASISDDNKEDEKKDDNFNATGYPIVNEPVTLEFLACREPYHNDFEEVYILQKFEEKSNVDIEWNCVLSEGFIEKRNLLITSDSLPDAIYRARLSNMELLNWGSDGVFIPLNDLIDDYAYALKEAFEIDPSIKRGITQPDGNIYSLPFIRPFESARYGSKLFFNTVWLDKLNVDYPNTTDELYNLLVKFKDSDLNGNSINDEVPFSAVDDDMIFSIFMGFFGLGNRGAMSWLYDVDPYSCDLRFIPSSDVYGQMVELMI